MLDRGWTDAQDLAADDQLIGHDGRTAVVDSVTHTGRHETVYSLRVEQHNTYFVSNEDWHFSVWVHNACFKKKQNDAGKWEITDADNNPINEVFDTEAAADARLAELNAPKTAAEPNRIYSARELMRRADDIGPNHNFPESFNKQIFAGNKQVISDNYYLYTRRGTLNGRAGTYEIGVRPSASRRNEVITHRFFRPDKK